MKIISASTNNKKISNNIKIIQPSVESQKNVLIQKQNNMQLSAAKVQNGKVMVDKDIMAQSKGFIDARDEASYKERNPDLYEGLGGIKYINPIQNTNKIGSPATEYDVEFASKLSDITFNKMVDQYKNIDYKDVEKMVTKIDSGKWLDANTMKKYDDMISGYVDTQLTLNGLGYFGDMPEDEKKSYFDSLRQIKSYVGNKKQLFANFENAESYNTALELFKLLKGEDCSLSSDELNYMMNNVEGVPAEIRKSIYKRNKKQIAKINKKLSKTTAGKEKFWQSFNPIGWIGDKYFGDTKELEDEKEKLVAANAKFKKYGNAADLSYDELKTKERDSTDNTDRLYYRALANQKYYEKTAKKLSKIKMDGEDFSVLEAMNDLAEMEKGKDKRAREKIVKKQVEKAGYNFDDIYSILTGDTNVSAKNLLKFFGKKATSGIALFSDGFYATADVFFGKPLQGLGWQNNPISVAREKSADNVENLQFDSQIYAERIGNPTWAKEIGQFTEGITGAAPYAVLAYLTKGASLSGSAGLAQTATAATGGTIARGKIALQNMARDPQFWTAFASTYGHDYEEAKKLGASDEIATLGATITSLVNSGIEIGLDGKSGIQGLTQQIKNGDKKVFRTWLESTGQEVCEEILQGLASRSVQKTLYDSDIKVFDIDAMTEEGKMGFAVGAALGGGQIAVSNTVNNVLEAKHAKNYYGFSTKSVCALVENGLAMPEYSDAYKLAVKADTKLKADKNLSGATLYNLATAIENEIENKSMALFSELGVDIKVAKELSPVVAKAVFGEQLTLEEQETLKNNRVAMMVAIELSFDRANTVWKDTIKNNNVNFLNSANKNAYNSNLQLDENSVVDNAEGVVFDKGKKVDTVRNANAVSGVVMGADGKQYYNDGSGDEYFGEPVSVSKDNAINPQVEARRVPELVNVINLLSGGENINIDEINSIPIIDELKRISASREETYNINTAERAAIRQEVLEKLLAKGSAVIDNEGRVQYNGVIKQEHRVDIVIGLSAAGKSSVLVDPLSEFYSSRVVDSDMAKELLPEFDNGMGANAVHRESQDIIEDVLNNSIINGDNIVHPIVGGNYDLLVEKINYLKINGYTVYLHLNELSNGKAIGRSLNRYIETGRFIPPEIIAKYGDKPTENFNKIINTEGLVDGYSHYSNDVARGESPRRIKISENVREFDGREQRQIIYESNQYGTERAKGLESPRRIKISENVREFDGRRRLDRPSRETEKAKKQLNNTESKATSKDEAASFIAKNNSSFDLSEPALKDIARAPTAEESIAAAISNEQLDTKQLRISDFVTKHFPEITLKFSGNMTKGGLWDPESKTLLLNTNQTVAGMYIEVLKHEFMHRLESKRLYQEFKQFLFNKDIAFGVWAKVQCKVNGIELQQNTTAKGAINSLADYYYNNVKNDMSIAKKYRDDFTVDGAQREMVADFFGEIMFNGKKYRTQTAQALADETFLTLFDESEIDEFEANSMAALAEIAKYKPNIFQQIVDWVKRIILKLRGTRIKADAILADELERNIKMLEDYVKQVYNSRDTKKAAENGGVEYKSISNNKITPNMDESTRADIIRKTSLNVVEFTDENAEFSGKEVLKLKSTYKSKAQEILKQLCEKFGVFKNYNNENIEINFDYSRTSLRESVHKENERSANFYDFAKMLYVFDDVVANAQAIETHTDKYVETKRENRNLKQVYVLMSAFKDGDFIIPVEFNIKEFVDETKSQLYVSVTLQKMKADLMAAPLEQSSYRTAKSTFDYSLSDIIKNVNPADKEFLKYIPDELLSKEQKTSKSEALSQEKERLDDMRYDYAVKNNPNRAKEMLDERRKGKGYEQNFDWRIEHKAPNSQDESAHSIDKLDNVYGSDIYSAQAVYYYGEGRKYDQKAVEVIQMAHNKPNAMIKIYRAVPTNIKDTRIRNGDWVAVTKEYADEHGYRWLDDDYRIIENTVPAKYLFNNGDSIQEFGYDNGDVNEVYKNAEGNVKLNDITYDDNGNVIPLSKRFDESNSDIKFAVTSQMQQLRYNPKTYDLELSEPTISDITRAPTAEESIAAAISNEQLDTKQLRISDFVTKHFPEITLKFSGNMTKDGLWDPVSKTLLLNTNQTVAGMYIEVLKHEFMHRLESKRLYQEFKQFLFNKDVTFGVWAKVQCKVHGIELTQNATASETISKLTDYYYDSVKNDMSIAKKYRDAFTIDSAQREMVADFFGEIMFNGKKYRTQTAQTLADETFITLFKEGEIADFEASSMAAMAEIAEYNPNIFQQIVDWVKRIILKLRGTRIKADAILADELERNIKMLEDYVKQVYNSRDTKKAAENGGGVEFSSIKNKNTIDLSHDNELSERIGKKTGTEKYKEIQTYILEVLEEQPVTLSDGRNAVVDRSDAQHIARGAGNKKISQISSIKSIVENAKLVAEEESTKERKFDYFYYYEATVKFGKDTYQIYLNVGRARNDALYHIYDITQKLRDTAHRINDVGRPVGNAVETVSLNESIPNSTENVNTEKSNDNTNDNSNDTPSGKYSLGSPIQKLKYGDEFELSQPDIDNIEISDEVEFLVGLNNSKLSETQKHIMDICRTLDSEFTVEFVDNLKTNGKFIRSQNKILIKSNLNAVQMYIEVFKHEFMHRLETKMLYSQFFNYCFKKSKAFEQYVRAELKSAGVEQNVDLSSRDSVREAYTKYKFNQYKNAEGIPKTDRDAFTMENAREEIIADFFAQILFQGKQYRARIIEALENADGESLIGIGDEVSSEAALMELQEKEPTLLEQVIEWLRDIIDKLRGMPQAKSVVSDLENELDYLEYLARKAYQSKDSKRLMKKKLADEKYLVGGEKSKTANHSLLFEAKLRAYKGEDSELIRRDTGWYEGRDSRWRYYIPDNELSIDRLIEFANSGEKTALLGDVIKHDKLFMAYPELKNVEVKFEDLAKYNNGEYLPDKNIISLNYELLNNWEILTDTLVHEVQHAIQIIEGFARGGNEKTGLYYAINAAYDLVSRSEQFNGIATKEERFDYLCNIALKLFDAKNLEELVYKAYLNIYGEVEARQSAKYREYDENLLKTVEPNTDGNAVDNSKEKNKFFATLKLLGYNDNEIRNFLKKAGIIYDKSRNGYMDSRSDTSRVQRGRNNLRGIDEPGSYDEIKFGTSGNRGWRTVLSYGGSNSRTATVDEESQDSGKLLGTGVQDTISSQKGPELAKRVDDHVINEKEATSQDGAAFYISQNDEIFELTHPKIEDIEISAETEFLVGLADKNFSKLQKHIIDIVHKLSSNLTVEFSNDIEGNGKFIRSQNKILIKSNLNAVQMYVEVFKHEFMHRLETKMLYNKFFNYCFKKSKAFEQYVRAELKSAGMDYNVDTATRDSVLEDYTKYKFNQYKNAEGITKIDRDAFTMENAREEIIADFFAQILFQGKKYRARIIKALQNADGEALIGIGDEASSEAALMELQEKEPTLFEQVVQWFKDVINKLRGLPQAKSLVEQLDNEINLLESMARRAYQSKDSKRLMKKKLDEIKFSLMNNNTFESNVDNIATMNDADALQNKEEGNFVRVMYGTPTIVRDNVSDAENLDVIISFYSLYLATRKNGILEGHYHNLGSETIKKLPEYISNPDAIVRTNNDRLNLFAQISTAKGNNGILSIELNTVKDINNHYDKYNLVITVFSANDNYTKNNIIKNTKKIEYQKENLLQVNPQLYEWLAIVNNKSSFDSIAEKEYIVNNEDSKRLIKKRFGEVRYSTDKSFAEQVEDVINGVHNPRYDLYISETPKYLIDLNFIEGPLLMRNSKIAEILEKHSEISKDTIKSLPEAMEEPILILKSKTHPTDSVVVITDIMTDKGEMIVPVWVNQEGSYIDIELGQINMNTNFIASSYGRDIKKLLEYANDNNGFLYQNPNMERVRKLLARNGLQLPTPLKLSDSDIIVPQMIQSVNMNSMQETDKYSSMQKKYDKIKFSLMNDNTFESNVDNKHKALNMQERNYIQKIGDKLGISIVFEDLREMVHKGEIVSPDGYIEKDKGIIHLNLYAENPIGFILKHELTHFAEKAEGYFEFVKLVKRSNLYQKWLLEKTDESNIRIAEYKYKQRVANTHSDISSVSDPKAEAEMIADFVGEMLFTENGSGMMTIANELNIQQRSAVVRFVLDFISYIKKKLSGISGMTLELSIMEDRFNELLFDAKNNNGVYDNDIRFSLKIKHTDGTIEELADVRDLTNEQAIEYLNQAKRGELRRETYIPIKKDTPATIIDTLEAVDIVVENRSLIMQVRKAQQAMSAINNGGKSKKHGNNIRSHAMGAEKIVEIINNLDNPTAMILQTNRYNQYREELPDNVAVFVEYNVDGKEGVAIVEFNSSIDPKFIGKEYGDTDYHTVVTIFEPDTERGGMPFDYIEELLSNPDNYELEIVRRQPARSATGEKHPNTSSELPSNSIIFNTNKNVKDDSVALTYDSKDRFNELFSEAMKKNNIGYDGEIKFSFGVTQNNVDAMDKKMSSSQYLAGLHEIRKAYVQDVKENYSKNIISNYVDEKTFENTDNIKHKVLSEQERGFVENICNKLGCKVVFEDLRGMAYKGEIISPDGYVKDHIIHLNTYAVNPIGFVLKHELTHYVEHTKGYKEFANAVTSSSLYADWIKTKTNKEYLWEAEETYRQKVYESQNDFESINDARIDSEIIADFVGEMLFTDNGSGAVALAAALDAKKRNAFVQFVLDFIRWIKAKLFGQQYLLCELSLLEDGYKQLLIGTTKSNNSGRLDNNLYVKEGDGTDISFCFVRSVDESKNLAADEMVKKGASTTEIYKELGLFKNVFGEWAFALDLNRYRFYPNGNSSTAYNLIQKVDHIEGVLRDVVYWEELFDLFPEFEKVRLIIRDSNNPYDTVRFIPTDDGGMICVNKKLCDEYRKNNTTTAKAEMLKAIQNMIQFKEGNYIGKSFEYWKDLEKKGELPFSTELDRYLTADDMMKFFIDNYEANMAASRQYIKDIVIYQDKHKRNLEDAVLYQPHVNRDLVIKYNNKNKLVTLSGKNTKRKLIKKELKQEIASVEQKNILSAKIRLKDFLLTKEKNSLKRQNIEKNEFIRGGESGFLESYDDEQYQRFQRHLEAIRDVSIANKDTIGRDLNEIVQERMDGSIAISEIGEPLSLYAMSLNDNDLFKDTQLGVQLTTVSAISEIYSENEFPSNVKCIECYAILKNPFYFKGEPYELSVGEIGLQLAGEGVITWEEYMHLMDMKSTTKGNGYNNPAIKRMRKKIIKAGYDGLIFENKNYDRGGMTAVVFDENQLIPVAKDGLLLEDNGVTEADYESHDFDTFGTTVEENIENLVMYVKEASFNNYKRKKPVDSRIRLGGCDYLENKNIDLAEIKNTLFANMQVEISGYDTAGRKFTKIFEKELDNCAFKNFAGDILTFCLWNTKNKNISIATKKGVEFGTVNSAFEKFFEHKEKTFQCYDGVFEEFILNCSSPLVLNLNGWNTVDVAKYLLKENTISQKYAQELFAMKDIESPTYSSYSAQMLRDKIKTLGYDCLMFRKDTGEMGVIPFYDNQIIKISENGIIVDNCNVFEKSNINVEDGIESIIIQPKRRTIRDFGEVKNVILTTSDLTQRIRILTDFMRHINDYNVEDFSKLKIGYSGDCEQGEVSIWRLLWVYNKLINNNYIGINERDTADRPLNNQVKNVLNGTKLKDESGRPLSFFLWNKYGKNRFNHSSLGYRVTTLNEAHNDYLKEKKKHPTLLKGEYEECFVNAQKIYVMKNIPKEFISKEFADEFYQNNIINDDEYQRVIGMHGIDTSENHTFAANYLTRKLMEKGFDCIIYMSELGSMGVIPLNKTQLVPITINGQPIKNNTFELAASNRSAFFIDEIKNNVEKRDNDILDDVQAVVYNENEIGLTKDEKQELKQKTGWSDGIIDFIRSIEEAQVYIDANLKEAEINGKKCLIRSDIDLDYVDSNGVTNRERMKQGKAPKAANGEEIHLHHIGQSQNSPLAELTRSEHLGKGNYSILHDTKKPSIIKRAIFKNIRKKHWKTRCNLGGN